MDLAGAFHEMNMNRLQTEDKTNSIKENSNLTNITK